jgi:omega-6 fatty acid desaturase (delta-12 desaturase)
MPAVVEAILHNIMQHSTHHIDVTIPLYRLHTAQRAVESATENGIIRYRFTMSSFLRHLRVCRLYDFERHRSLDFDGRPPRP